MYFVNCGLFVVFFFLFFCFVKNGRLRNSRQLFGIFRNWKIKNYGPPYLSIGKICLFNKMAFSNSHHHHHHTAIQATHFGCAEYSFSNLKNKIQPSKLLHFAAFEIPLAAKIAPTEHRKCCGKIPNSQIVAFWRFDFNIL